MSYCSIHTNGCANVTSAPVRDGVSRITKKKFSHCGVKNMAYPWMSYTAAHAYESEAERYGVSTVARSARGFMREYERAGTARAMVARPLPQGVHGGETWKQKRNGFVARHMTSYRENPTYRRYLALIMWAYKPPGPPPPHRNSTRSRRSR